MTADVDTLVTLTGERAALARARRAVQGRLAQFSGISGGGADALSDEYIDAVVTAAIETFRRELVVFGRVDDDQPWRIGLYGIDADGEQLVVDWRAPLSEAFYQASFDAPRGMARRVSYLGCIDDLFVEHFDSGEVSGSSPLLGELSRSRGASMRTAVATLQADQDRLVRLDADARLVVRGGPGTGKTVVGLHRAAWLVYNDRRITAERILVLGPSDRFLRFVSAVLPTLGEARITQTTLARLLGPSKPAADLDRDEEWLALVDALEAELPRPSALRIGRVRVPESEVAELVATLGRRSLSWRERRSTFAQIIANRYELARGDVTKAAAAVLPSCSTAVALRRLARRGADAGHGPFADEVGARFDEAPMRFSHAIVDEAQDLGLLEMRAVLRRAGGVTMVGDDAQRSRPDGLGLERLADHLGVRAQQMTTAYRMSAEIATWLNEHARRSGIDAVHLDGIRPTGVTVAQTDQLDATVARLRSRWENVAVITADDVWSHKGVEYDAVAVIADGMSAVELYLAASRAAHELAVITAAAPPHSHRRQ